MIYQILIVALLFEVLLACLNPKYAISICVTIIFLIPNTLKFNVGINLNAFNLAILIVILSLSRYKANEKCKYISLKKTLIFYFSYVIVTSFLFSDDKISFGEYVQNMILFLMEYGLLAYFMCWVSMSEKEIEVFNYVLLAVIIVIVSYAFVNYALKANPYRAYISLITNADIDMADSFLQEQRGFLDGRVSSVFGHPLVLGQWVVLVFNYVIFEFKNRIYPLYYYILLIILFLTAVLTGSRSSLVPVLLSSLLYIIQFGKAKVVKYLICGGMVFLISYPLLPSKIQDSIEATVFFWDDDISSKADIKGSSKEGRFEQFELAMSSVSDNPLFGKGFNYNVKYRDSLPTGLAGVESVLLSHTIDGGIVGLLVFFFFYYRLFRVLMKKCQYRRDKYRVTSLMLSYFVAICLTGVTYSFFCVFLIFYMITLYRISNANRNNQVLVKSIIGNKTI